MTHHGENNGDIAVHFFAADATDVHTKKYFFGDIINLTVFHKEIFYTKSSSTRFAFEPDLGGGVFVR
jgi:hypothetical protein